MNGPGVNHLPFPISNLWRLQLVIQKLVPAIQKLVPASQKLPAIQKLLPAIQKLSAIQMLLVLRARLLFGRRNHTGRLGKRSRTQSRIGRRTGRRRTGLRKLETGLEEEDPEDAEAQEYWGGNAWEKHYLPDAWKKERGTKGKKRKAWIEGQIMSLKQEGRWVGGIYFLEAASPHERGLLVLFNLHAGWRATE